MMCEKCGKNPATTHVKTVMNGVVHEKNLCAYCAAKVGSGCFGNLSLANMRASMFGDGIESGRLDDKRCPCCGSLFSDIVESGRVGCSECYDTFREELMPSLQRLHGNTVHVGKTPGTQAVQLTKERKLKQLKKELSQAVQAEEFEKAAKLRDEIRFMEKDGGDHE